MKPEASEIDPNVKIPAAVRAAAKRADEAFHAYRDHPVEEQPAEPAAEAPAEPPVVTSQGNPEQSPASLAKEPAAEAPAEAPATGEDETWEHKYKSVNGRYVRLQEQLRTALDRITDLQNVIASLQTAPAPAKAEPAKAERLITPEEETDYGTDFLNVVGKKAREELLPVISQYEQKIGELEKKLQGVNGVVQQTAHEKMLAGLDSNLPNWRELNVNPEFLSWLRLPDPYSGAIRHDMLKAAYAQGQANRVLAFFNGFLAEEAAVAPAQAEPDNRGTRVPKVPLETLAAPGRAKTAASASAPAEKPIFTRAQIAAFYADVAAGRYRTYEAERAKIESQIFAAQADGRIR